MKFQASDQLGICAVVHAQALKLSWTEVGYREPSETAAFAVPESSDSKRQRVSDDTTGGGRYHRGLRLDGSRCLAALDGAAMHASASQLGSALGPPTPQHPAGVANGIPANAARRVLAGLVLELVDEGSGAEQGYHAVALPGVMRRGDSMRWVVTLPSAYLAGLEPGSEGLGRAVRRAPGGVAFEYSMAAGAATRALLLMLHVPCGSSELRESTPSTSMLHIIFAMARAACR